MKFSQSTHSLSLTAFIIAIMFLFAPFVGRAQGWAPPSGPPPNNNAPAPIHEGSTGQAKYFGNGGDYTIGALGLIAEGVFSDFSIADGEGVAATKFCLGTEGQIDSSNFPSGTTGLDCVDASSGWGVGDGLPSATAGQTLFYNSATGEWEASDFFRSFNGGVGSSADNIFFGTALPGPSNDIPVSLSLTGNLSYMNPDQPASFYYGKVLGNPGPVDGSLVGAVSWLDPSTLGIGGSLPNGVHTLPKMDILTWDSTTSQWVPAVAGQGQNKGYHTTYGFFATKGFAFAGSTAETGCKANDTVSIQTTGTGVDTYHRIVCNDFIKVTYNSTGNTTLNEVRISTPNAVFTKLTHGDAQNSRPVCAESDGDVVLCENLATGFWQETEYGTEVFEVPMGVYEINVELVGAGGGGGAGGFGASLNLINPNLSSNNSVWDEIFAGGGGGGGGGRGETITQTLSVVPGQEYEIVVGKGGKGGCPQRQSPSQWWAMSTSANHEYCGQQNWNPSGNNVPWNGKGENGQDSSISCVTGCTSNISLSSNGGNGGGLGNTIQWYNSNSNGEALDQSGILGGAAGSNGDGSVTASSGSVGNVYYNSELSNDPPGGIAVCNVNGGNAFGNIIYTFIYPGGQGGAGSNGYNGGSAGNSSYNFTPNFLTCNPYTLGTSGHGGTGGIDFMNGAGGSGGGGGNSQHPGGINNPGTNPGYGYGGVGGFGRDGKVVITW